MNTSITPQDIKAKKSSDASGANKIRQAWALQLSEEKKDILKRLPAETRKEFYKEFDKEVQAAWTNDLKAIRESNVSTEIDPDEVLISAALKWTEALELSNLVKPV